MAVPFTVPIQDTTHLSVQEILRELYELIHQLLVFGPQPPLDGEEAPAGYSSIRQYLIQELVSKLFILIAALNTRHQQIPIRNLHQRVRRHRTPSESSCWDDAKTSANTSSNEQPDEGWIEMGKELHKLAQDFKSTGFKADKTQEESSPASQTPKSLSSPKQNIFSKFVPAPFTGSICTAVICVVGWHLLRNR